MKNAKSQQGFTTLILVAVIVAAIAAVGLYVVKNQTSKSVDTATVKSTRPGIVASEIFASSLDAKGAAVQPSKTFSPTTPTIYTVMNLKGAKANQRLEYTRYLNGKYVDKGSLNIAKADPKHAMVTFSLKPGLTHPKGVYNVKTYSNGVFERSAKYTVQ